MKLGFIFKNDKIWKALNVHFFEDLNQEKDEMPTH